MSSGTVHLYYTGYSCFNRILEYGIYNIVEYGEFGLYLLSGTGNISCGYNGKGEDKCFV
jgi:hypothetical protein